MSDSFLTTRLCLTTLAFAGAVFLAVSEAGSIEQPPAELGEDGAPEQSLAEQLSADTEAGLLSEDEAAIYSFLALFAPDELPASYESLFVDVPFCATGVVRAARDAATRVEPELSEAVADALPDYCSQTFAHSIRSSVYPLIVHYEDAGFAPAAADTLRYAEEQWDLQVLTMGHTAPLLDGGACGPDENIDIFLLVGAATAALAVAPNPATFYDDWSTYMEIDPNIYNIYPRELVVAHEFHHMVQSADDDREINVHEGTAMLIEEVVNDDFNRYFIPLPSFASRPHSCTGNRSTFSSCATATSTATRPSSRISGATRAARSAAARCGSTHVRAIPSATNPISTTRSMRSSARLDRTITWIRSSSSRAGAGSWPRRTTGITSRRVGSCQTRRFRGWHGRYQLRDCRSGRAS
jgi:hypothetical protein